MPQSKPQILLIKAGLIIWALWVVLNYLIHHPAQILAITEAPYIGTLLSLGVLIGGLGFWYKTKAFKLRGWMIYGVALLCMIIIFHGFAQRANLYTDSPISHVFYFIINNVLLHLGTLGVFALCYTAGKWVVKPFTDIMDKHQQGIVSVAAGMGIITLALMLLGAIGFLQSLVVIPLALLLVVWQRQSFISFIQYIIWNPIPDKSKSNWTIAFVASTLIVVSFSLVGAIKYFPLGHDGAALYQNVTKLLIENNQLLAGGAAYNWPLFSTIGSLLFGGMIYSIFLSHVVNLLCIWVTYHLGRLFLSVDGAWMAVAGFFTLPAVGYHSFTDEKVDLAFLFVGLSILLFLLNYIKKSKQSIWAWNKENIIAFVLLGSMMGFLMGVKYLAVFFFIGVVALLTFLWGGTKGFAGLFLLMLAALFGINADAFGNLELSAMERYSTMAILVLLGIGLMGYFHKSLQLFKSSGYLKLMSCMALSFFLTFGPWILKNTYENKSISADSILNGKKENDDFNLKLKWLIQEDIDIKLPPQIKEGISEFIDVEDIDALSNLELFQKIREFVTPEMKKKLRNTSFMEKTGKSEELQRYMGYESVLPRFISLPLDISLSSNISNKKGTDFGFLFLVFLPLLFFVSGKVKQNLITLFTFIILLLISWKATLNYSGVEKSVTDHLNPYVAPSPSLMELGQALYEPVLSLQTGLAQLVTPLYTLLSKANFTITLLFLILLFSILIWFSKANWAKVPSSVKLLSVITFVYGFLWWLFGSGVPYYAMISFLLATLVLVYFIKKGEKIFPKAVVPFFNKWSHILVGVLLTLNVFNSFTNKENVWSALDSTFFFPFINQVSSGFQRSDIVLKEIAPEMDRAVKIINQNKDTYVYRVGTYFNYHIAGNNVRVYQDNQLNGFNRLSRILQNPDDFLVILKRIGFKYIVLDLNVASIDQTAEKTLIKKANEFVKILNNQQLIRILGTDKVVSRVNPNTGQQQQVYGLIGQPVKEGTFAVFEIL